MSEKEVDVILDWDDEIDDGSSGGTLYPIVPKGTYGFRVIEFKRGRHEKKPTGKAPSCPKAMLSLDVLDPETGERLTNIKKDLLLCKSCEWILASFFRAIGAKKHGEAAVMDWGKVPAAEGSFDLSIREYKAKSGDMVETNEVANFNDAIDNDAF